MATRVAARTTALPFCPTLITVQATLRFRRSASTLSLMPLLVQLLIQLLMPIPSVNRSISVTTSTSRQPLPSAPYDGRAREMRGE